MTVLTRRLVTTTTAVAMMAATAVTMAQADLPLPADDTAVTPAVASTPDEPGDLAIAYPGTAPGAPTVTLTGEQVRLSNAVVSVDISLAGNDVAISKVHDVVKGSDVGISTSKGPVVTFGTQALDLSSGTRTAPTLVAVAAEPGAARLAERHAGNGVQAQWTLTPTTGAAVTVTWLAYLREGSNYVSQTWTIAPAATAPGSTANFSNAVLLDAETSGAAYRGKDDGYPVTFGAEGRETAWVGVENPTVTTAVTNTSTKISIKRAKPVTVESPISYTAAIGVAPEGQLRRSFTYYLERERIRARRNFLHYQSWYDLQPNPDGLNINPDKLTKAIDIFGGEMTKRDAKVDSYWVDDGWDYLRDPAVADESDLQVWDFDPTYYPDGFAPQLAKAASYGGSMSAWMSPFGGYGESPVRRGALNLSKPVEEQFEMYSPSSFKLAGDKYYAHFRERMYDLIDNNGVQGFKLDGIGGGLYQTGPNETYRADYENLLKLSKEVHEHAPDTWINATVGTYGSPYWMWFVDSIYRDGNDARMTGQGTGQQQYVNYRDGQTYQNIVVEANLVPITTLMNHGFVFSNTTFGQVVDSNDLSDPDVRKKVADDLRNYYAMGFGLQEMYVKHSIVDPETLDAEDADWFWDTMAANAKWARANTALLTDAHWIGGDPAANELYGTAAWTNLSGTDEAMIMVRNPSKYRVSIPLELGRDLELPDGAATKYRFAERDGQATSFVAEAGTTQHVVLEPFQVLLFEGSPSTDAVTPSEPVTVDPSLLPLPSTCWSASADSEETSESAGAANAIDGDPGSKWHTAWSTGSAPYPHQLTVDMGATNNVTKVGYLRRQDGGDNGNIKGYVLQVSTDGSTWLDAAAGDFANNADEQILEIPADLRDARFLRLKALSSHNGAAFAAVAELNVYGTAGDSGQLDRADWRVTTDSEQASGENGLASNAIDCKLSTYWHTQYDPSDDPMPHELVIDMAHPAMIDGFEWTGRQDLGTNGLIGAHEILVSTNGEDWTSVATGTFTGRAKQMVAFDAVQARWVKLVATSAQNGGKYAGAAEVNVVGEYIRLVLPDELVVDDKPGTGSDSYTVPVTAHVQYLVNGNVKAPGTYVVPEGTTLVIVTASALDGYLFDEQSPSEWRLAFSLDGGVEPTPTPTASASVSATATATATTTATATQTPTATSTVSAGPTVTSPAPSTVGPAKPGDVYTTPGLHFVNGRHWWTTCEPYSQTIRCRTDIWSTQVAAKGGQFVSNTGWHFNNLTYLPSNRGLWKGNPLGFTGTWTDQAGRTWMTECDTPRTGRNGCRTWIRTDVVEATAKPGGGYSYRMVSKFVFNNLVLFS